MEAVASKNEVQAKKPVPNQALIVGRIDGVGSFEGKDGRITETLIAIAAADVYSMPGKVVVQSKSRLGNKGDDIEVLVSVTGIPNSWVDKTTGEVKKSANVRLLAVE